MVVAPVPEHRPHRSPFRLETGAGKWGVTLAVAGIVLYGVAWALDATVSHTAFQIVLWGWAAVSLASGVFAAIAYRLQERSAWLLLPALMGVLCAVAVVWNVVVQLFGGD